MRLPFLQVWACFAFISLFFNESVFAQISIGEAGQSPHPSAMLDVESTNKGLLVPRMTSIQRTLIASPAIGLLVFDTDTESFWFNESTGWVELVSGNVKTLSDADGDTKVQVEESNDEDMIRFDVAGNERWRMTSNRLEAINPINSIFIGQDAGLNNSLVNSQNVFLGHNAGKFTTTGKENVAVGFNGLVQNQTGSNNTAIGQSALGQNNANGNTALGKSALALNGPGSNNVGVGAFVGSKIQEGNRNVLLGFRAGDGSGLHNKNENVMVGYQAGQFNETDGNIFIGYRSGRNETGANKLYIENSDADSTAALLYGNFANDLLRINGILNINGAFSFPNNDGTAGQVLQTDGSGALSWGDKTVDTDDQTIDVLNLNGTTLEISLEDDGQANQTVDLSAINSVQAILADADNDTKIQVEESSDEDIIRFDVGGTERWRMKNTQLEPVNSGNTVFIGLDAGLNDIQTDSRTIYIGNEAGRMHDHAVGSVAIGDQAFELGTTGLDNVAIGNLSLQKSNGNFNVSVGSFALQENINGSRNTAVGYGAGHNSTGNDNVFLGQNAGTNETGDDKLYIQNSSSANPLIYGEFDNDLVRINGTLEVDQKISAINANGLALATDEGTTRLKVLDGGDVEIDQKLRANDASGLELATDEGTTRLKILDSGDVEIDANFKLGQNGSTLSSFIKHSEVIDLPNIGSQSGQTLNITVTGATTNATVMVSPDDELPGGVVISSARVSAADTVRIKWRNTGTTSNNPAAMTYRITVINH